MAMEAAESAYLAQLAADAKADAAAGYVEPWTMPASLDQFAGEEGATTGACMVSGMKIATAWTQRTCPSLMAAARMLGVTTSFMLSP